MSKLNDRVTVLEAQVAQVVEVLNARGRAGPAGQQRKKCRKVFDKMLPAAPARVLRACEKAGVTRATVYRTRLALGIVKREDGKWSYGK